MYPQRELNQLAILKAALRRDIALHRAQCTEAAERVVKPLEWLDRVVAFWRRLSPLAKLAAVPLGLLAKRTLFSKRKVLGSLFRWGPVIFSVVRLLMKNRAVAAAEGPQD
jgi:hypothetical protein